MEAFKEMRKYREAFTDGVSAENARVVTYLIEQGIVRRDAFGVLVRETMGDDVTDLPDLDGVKIPTTRVSKIFVDPSEIGAAITRTNFLNDKALHERLFALREIAPAGSEVSLAITKWMCELV
jgi:hypothetical protein